MNHTHLAFEAPRLQATRSRGSIPREMFKILPWLNIFRPHYGPCVDSAWLSKIPGGLRAYLGLHRNTFTVKTHMIHLFLTTVSIAKWMCRSGRFTPGAQCCTVGVGVVKHKNLSYRNRPPQLVAVTSRLTAHCRPYLKKVNDPNSHDLYIMR